MRQLVIFKAHVRANLACLRDMLTFNWLHIKTPLMVYSRSSVEESKGRARLMTRQVGVGYWTYPQPGRTRVWVDYRIFFLEVYNMETQSWNRVMHLPKAPPLNNRPRLNF